MPAIRKSKPGTHPPPDAAFHAALQAEQARATAWYAEQARVRAEEARVRAEQQRLREEAAARLAEEVAARLAARVEAERLAVLAEYAARQCVCCPGEIEDRTEQQQDLIDYIRTDGIQCEFDDDGIQMSASFHPQELLNELAIHLADGANNDWNTEAVIRWKIQYLYNHSNHQDGLRADGLDGADWQRTGLAMGDYQVNPGDDDRLRANVV